jgi:hypothetical protein
MGWYCIFSAVGCEARVLAGLQQRKFLAYLPIMVMCRRVRGRLVECRAPLLGRYLFACPDCLERLAQIRAVPGVQEILPHEHEPQVIPAGEVERMMAREEAGEFVFRPTMCAPAAQENSALVHGIVGIARGGVIVARDRVSASR